MRPLRQPVYVILGTMFLLLGALGLFLPVLPTTPFWLLTCWFYLRGSNRLYARVMRNPYFGGYMRGFLEEKAIPLHGKIVTVVVMWGSAISTFLFLDVHWAINLLILAVAIDKQSLTFNRYFRPLIRVFAIIYGIKNSLDCTINNFSIYSFDWLLLMLNLIIYWKP